MLLAILVILTIILVIWQVFAQRKKHIGKLFVKVPQIFPTQPAETPQSPWDRPMIDIDNFLEFLRNNFDSSILSIDDFKPDLKFASIDCLKKSTQEIVLEISPDTIKIDNPAKDDVDFIKYYYARTFWENKDAEKFLLEVKTSGIFPNKK